MLDVVVTHRETGEEVERLHADGERDANKMLSALRGMIAPEYRVDVMPARSIHTTGACGLAESHTDEDHEAFSALMGSAL